MLVLGKGGVGRTTVARGLVATALRAGQTATCVELGTGGRSGASSVVLDPTTVVEDTAAAVFGSRRVAHAVVGNFAIRRVLDVVPAIREYALLCAALALTQTHQQVVVDMPATGHALAWLGVARRLATLVPGGAVRAQADRLDAALRDPRLTTIVVVAVPEPLVLGETLELREALRAELGRDADLVVMNHVPAEPAGARALAALTPGAAELVAWLDARERIREVALDAAPGVPLVVLAAGVAPPNPAELGTALTRGALS